MTELVRVTTDRIAPAEQLRVENEKRLQQGLMAPIDVMQAVSTKAVAEIGLIRAKFFHVETETRLRGLIFSDFPAAADTRFELLDSALTESLPALRDLALERNAEYQVVLQRVESAAADRFAKVPEQKAFAAQGTQNRFRDQVVSEGEAIEKRIERDIAKLQHQIALEQLDRRKIRPPIDGVVVEKKKEAGEAVDMNEPVFHLVDISRVYLQVFIAAAEALRLKAGQPVAVSFPEYGTQAHRGTIDFVE